MAIYFEKTDRLIIPRWREYSSVHTTSDHLPAKFTPQILVNSSHKDEYFQQKIHAWVQQPNVGNAWELINSAFIDKQYDAAVEAARFLKEQGRDFHPNLNRIILEILGEELPLPSSNNISHEGLQSITAATIHKIRQLKQRISKYPRNEFAWVELARLYSIMGVNAKARNCIIVAIQLSNKKNRYILRAASRFFYHIHEYDVAQRTVRLCPFIKDDPWLLSADLSYSEKMERRSIYLKHSLALIKSKNYTDASISELSGMLGTIEFQNHAIKSARKLTNQSLRAPNDNSLAQAEWIARKVGDIAIDSWIDGMEYGYEARAFKYLYEADYNKGIAEGVNWVLDQPFSKRASQFVTYICTGVTDNHSLAIEAGKHGVVSNPNDFTILNNLTFAYVSTGDFASAQKFLSRMHDQIADDKNRCVYHATKGFLAYRSNNPEAGAFEYRKAIEIAEKRNYRDCKTLAEAYQLRESCLVGQLPQVIALSALERLQKHARPFDVNVQINHIINTLRKVSKGIRMT